MKIEAFRIKHFRSIVDTGWCKLSSDGITVLIGQNESGKTSILAALSKLGEDDIDDDDLRISEPLPEISVKLTVSFDEVAAQFDKSVSSYSTQQIVLLRNYFSTSKSPLELQLTWRQNESPSSYKYSAHAKIDDEILNALISHFPIESEPRDVRIDNNEEYAEEHDSTETDLQSKNVKLTVDDVAQAVWLSIPAPVLFDERTGLLPDRVDIKKNEKDAWVLHGTGATAAQNFLDIADVSVSELVKAHPRAQENILGRANSTINRLFGNFWTQTIGKTDKIQLKCVMHNYGSEQSGKVGQPHLAFWIGDGQNQVHPKQRSQGVRWFISFFLQLTATQKRRDQSIFLLDEPGANLHGKAQSDVLKLLNKLRDDLTIVYSTHTPGLVEYEKLYRVLAIQRDGDRDDSPTIVIDAHKLGAASRDTLTALLSAMGSDLAQQQVIKKHDNVILEEISAFYYLRAFWDLTRSKQQAQFIAATGANNVEMLANLFLGWGIDFIVALDDEATGRGVYNRLKRFLYGDNEEGASRNMYKFKGCNGIEDVFSPKDFRRHVLLDETCEFAVKNSEYVKTSGRAKPVLAYQFLLAVNEKKIRAADLEKVTLDKIQEVVAAIEDRLKLRRDGRN